MSFDAAEQRGFNRRTRRIDSDTRSVEPGASMSTTETKVTHTPGPWKLDKPTESGASISYEIRRAGREIGYIGHFGRVLPNDYRNNFAADEQAKEQHRANAHVIAAAPDMLEALEYISARIGLVLESDTAPEGATGEMLSRWKEHADTAIARAKGGAA